MFMNFKFSTKSFSSVFFFFLFTHSAASDDADAVDINLRKNSFFLTSVYIHY